MMTHVAQTNGRHQGLPHLGVHEAFRKAARALLVGVDILDASYNNDNLTRRVLDICRLDIALPSKTTLIVASLTSQIVGLILLSRLTLLMHFLN